MSGKKEKVNTIPINVFEPYFVTMLIEDRDYSDNNLQYDEEDQFPYRDYPSKKIQLN
jgi:hypothetical protein